MSDRLKALEAEGQAVWLDFVERGFLAKGGLKKLVKADGVSGVTSNPSIFEKAMGHGDAYDKDFAKLLKGGDLSVIDLYERLAIADIQAAADALRPVYDRLDGADGYVSIEVSPYLAKSTEETIAEARRLWRTVDRPNLMVKVPGTKEGVPAIRTLIADGININVTLLFAIDAYEAVAKAFVAGLEARAAKGEDISRIASVASFFVSRIDGQIDKKIDDRVKARDAEAPALKAIRGKVAIANAKLAYQSYLKLVGGKTWKALAAKGAMPQRLLWASTGTKDPAYSDVLYVETLIGRDTVNTMPPKTMDAFRDHGEAAETLTQDVKGAKHVLAEADRLGLDLKGVTEFLVDDGVKLFADAADTLLGALTEKRSQMLGDKIDGMEAKLPDALAKAVDERLKQAASEGWQRRLWKGDPTLWTNNDEGKWLGWLPAALGHQVDAATIKAIAKQGHTYRDVVLLGMGGSSLGPEVIGLVLGSAKGAPKLHVLDSSDPGQIGTVTAAIDPAKTLFIVSSKSGSTMEPELLRTYFFDLTEKAVGKRKAGGQFIAVTDPGSHLEKTAKKDGFAHIALGDPAIGGRYSVLSAFGMVPAAAIGIDLPAFFAATLPMVQSCGADVPPAANPGVRLGAILGEAANAGRNKLTVIASDGLTPVGAWLEQLLAESTGKQGKGIVPVDLEPVGKPACYGDDRLFAYLHLKGDAEVAHVAALEKAGQPVVRITLADRDRIGQEFFRWEIATAVAGAVIGIDPFDQPDVEAAKIKTREMVDAYEKTGKPEQREPGLKEGALSFFAAKGASDATALLKAHFAALKPGGYAGFLAYIERNEAHEKALTAIRLKVRDAKKAATVVGFGPRFLHSTGQAYKGGPAGGVFLEITRSADPDLPIPDHRATFGVVQVAQAMGDLDVLAERGRTWLRVHIDGDVEAGLKAIGKLVAAALA